MSGRGRYIEARALMVIYRLGISAGKAMSGGCTDVNRSTIECYSIR